MNTYYFVNVNQIVQPVIAPSRAEAAELVATKFGTSKPKLYNAMQWPTVLSRLEKKHAKKLIMLDAIRAKAKENE